MGEAKRRGTFDERMRQSKLREVARYEDEELRWAEHRQKMVKKTLLGGRQSGRGLMAAAVAIAGGGYNGMIERVADATRRTE